MRISDRCQGHGRNVGPEAGDALQITIFLEAFGDLLDGLFNTAQLSSQPAVSIAVNRDEKIAPKEN
jgi:hypothetical protein